MARIVFAIWGSLGDLHPYLAIAGELQNRGHHCVMATNQFHRDRIQSRALEFAPMGPHLEADPVMLKKAMHLRRGPRYLVRDLVIPYTWPAFSEMMAIPAPNLLVTHPITYAAHVAAQFRGVRWASTVLAPSGMFSVHEPSIRMQSRTLAKLETLGP